MYCPVTHAASFDANHAATPAMSSASPMRPRAVSSRESLDDLWVLPGVSREVRTVRPGPMAFTVMPRLPQLGGENHSEVVDGGLPHRVGGHPWIRMTGKRRRAVMIRPPSRNQGDRRLSHEERTLQFTVISSSKTASDVVRPYPACRSQRCSQGSRTGCSLAA